MTLYIILYMWVCVCVMVYFFKYSVNLLYYSQIVIKNYTYIQCTTDADQSENVWFNVGVFKDWIVKFSEIRHFRKKCGRLYFNTTVSESGQFFCFTRSVEQNEFSVTSLYRISERGRKQIFWKSKVSLQITIPTKVLLNFLSTKSVLNNASQILFRTEPRVTRRSCC